MPRTVSVGALLPVLLLGTFFTSLPLQKAPEKEPLPSVDLLWNTKIPMRDGVKLHAIIYKPQYSAKPAPVILSITPYQTDNYHERGMYYAKHGYVYALVDARGRGNSAGEFEPFVHEGRDGYDVVEWLARQPWCDGKVGMWGGSYGGSNQWLTLKQAPPHLKTIVPVASAHPGVDFPAPGGIFGAYFLQWLTLTSGNYNNQKLFNDARFWMSKYRQRYLAHLPFAELDQSAGMPNRHFATWIKHRRPDAYWDAIVLSPQDYARIQIPILTITGHYDGDQLGAMEYYQRHQLHGSLAGFGKHYLIMGPWDHNGTRLPKQEIGGVFFGKASVLDIEQIHKEWYDWTLKGGPKPSTFDKGVTYYVAGAEEWRYADALQTIPTTPRKYYLSALDGQANDAFRSGTLTTQPGDSKPARYRYDPLDVRPVLLEQEKGDNYLSDQRHALHLHGNGLVYHSEPFAAPLDLVGHCKGSFAIALNVPDTDFLARLYEIKLDGSSILLTEDRLRARHRESLRTETLVKPGVIQRYEFSSFLFTGRTIQVGSRLRLVFSCPNSIFLEKNYNSGGAVERETRADARTAEVTVYQDAANPSYLELPIVRR